ncbi:MAG: carbohydrate binding domain-containing protein, partial [Acholeplasmataceae bacterium]|nr:carbohydrate binding domain-containing protein [Acholeplasmataceae bacterium]
MKKRILVMALVLLSAFVLVACNDPVPTEPIETPTPTAPVLSVITLSGVTAVTLEFQQEFNVLTGVTAMGNDGVNYTSQITYVSTSAISATHMLDTTKTGTHAIRYEVRIGSVLVQSWRQITVKSPAVVEGEYLINPDFALGTAGWDDPFVVYNADGSSMTLSTEAGALKAEVVAGSNVYTPRFGQMNVPFKQGQAYRVSFDAKSSVNKTINLQVGELLASAPWFTDFKPGNTVHKLITTEWATYSYEFMHTLDNKRGGVLFELGALNGLAVNATLWFDNVLIEEITLGSDETAPMISGVANKSILLNAAFNPLTGVTATDDRDGDVTADIVVVIKNSLNEVVTTINTAVEATYTITYTVEDAAGNVATATMTLEVVAMQFSATNKVVNPSFATALNATTPEWAVWYQDWGTAPVVVHGIDTVAGVYNVDITGGGDAAWAIQLHQSGLITVEEGKTYRLSFTVQA